MRRRNPVSDETRSRARELRLNATQPERRLWRCLRNRKLAGLKFFRQASIGAFIVDFLCREEKLVIEVDGDSHSDRAQYDTYRARNIERLGFRIVRVSNDDVIHNIEGVLSAIVVASGIDIERWRTGELGQVVKEC